MIELDGTTWLLDSLDGRPRVAGTEITLSFEGGVAFGSDGCNRFRASYEVGEGGRVSVSPGMATTLMACAEDVMAQAAAFSDALREVAFLRRDDGVLVLLDHSDAVRATFKVQDRSLEDTDWVVTGFNNGRQAVVSVLAGTELTATFADGMVGGSGGCNRYRASFEMDGDRIRIGPAATSRRSCGSPGGVMEQEAQFLRAIESVAAAWMEGDRLELRTADGALAVSLVRAR